MRENFPNLWDFNTEEHFGYEGWLQIRGRLYQIVVQASIEHYPILEPKVYLEPKPELHHWIRHTGYMPYLCYERMWHPNRSTLASCVAVAIRYINQFGG